MRSVDVVLLAAASASAYSLAPSVGASAISSSSRAASLVACEPIEDPEPRSLSRSKKAAVLAACAAGLVGGAAPGALSRFGIGAAPAYAADAAVEAPAAAKKPLSAAAQKRLKLALKSKLAKVPVFMVTNEGGSPFLNRLASGDQSALMFIFPAEAEKMLEGVLRAPNGATSGAKVFPTNLDRAFKLARLQPMASGLRDQITNRELTMVWQFMPHAAEQRAAQALMIQTRRAPVVPKIPAYISSNLVFTKKGRDVRPVFLARKDLDAAVIAAAEADPDAAKPEVVVVDLLEYLLQLAEGIEDDTAATDAEIAALEVVAPSDSLALRDQLRSEKAPLKAKIVPPDHRYH